MKALSDCLDHILLIVFVYFMLEMSQFFFCQALNCCELPNETQIAAQLVVLVASGNNEEHVVLPAKYLNMSTHTLKLTSPCQTGMIDFKAIPETFRAESSSISLAMGSVLNSHSRPFIFPRLTGTITSSGNWFFTVCPCCVWGSHRFRDSVGRSEWNLQSLAIRLFIEHAAVHTVDFIHNQVYTRLAWGHKGDTNLQSIIIPLMKQLLIESMYLLINQKSKSEWNCEALNSS